jgi:hypothetical protein
MISENGADFTLLQWLKNLVVGYLTWKDPGAYTPFGKTQPALPEDMDVDTLKGKAVRMLHPNQTARAYVEAMNNKPEAFKTVGRDGKESVYSKVKVVDNKETGFSGAIYMNEDGHAVVFYAGMDGRTNPASVTADVRTYWLAEQGYVNNQAGDAQDLYVEAARMANSVEVVGVSLGTIHTNMLAALYGAKATNMSDIGLPPVYETKEGIGNVRDNVVSLRVEGDSPPVLPGWLSGILSGMGKNVGGYGDGVMYAGKIHSREVTLARPTDEQILGAVAEATPQHGELVKSNTEGLEHLPQAYMFAQDRIFEAEQQSAGARANNFYNNIAPGQQI